MAAQESGELMQDNPIGNCTKVFVPMQVSTLFERDDSGKSVASTVCCVLVWGFWWHMEFGGKCDGVDFYNSAVFIIVKRIVMADNPIRAENAPPVNVVLQAAGNFSTL